MIVNKMAKAENMRYAKIQQLIHLLCQEDKTILDDIMEDSVNQSFHVGRKIMVNDRTITVKNKTYMPYELKVTINTEGSMAIYDHSGKKLCGSIYLNVSTKNVELFSLWVRKCNIPVKVVSEKGERIFQWFIFAVGLAVLVLLKFLI